MLCDATCSGGGGVGGGVWTARVEAYEQQARSAEGYSVSGCRKEVSGL
jgi:hypothetical protein